MSATIPPLRIVIAGLGVMGSHHLRVLRETPGAEVTALVDTSGSRRTEVAARYPDVPIFAALDEAIERRAPDLACLALPVAALPVAARTAMDRGLHVFVEKPMAPTAEEAEAMIERAAAEELTLGVGHVERFNPAVVALRERLSEGLIGDVHQMHARRLSPFPNREGALGVALDLATHDIDVMRFVTGHEVRRVYAEVANPLSGAGEDLLCATLRFDDDATGLLEVNWMTPTKVRQLSITGERGMLVVDYLAQDLSFYEHPTRATEWDTLAGMRGGGEGNMVRYALDRREPLRVQWEEFLEAVRSGARPPVDGRDGLAALSTALAIVKSGAVHEPTRPSYRASGQDAVAG